MKGEEMEKSTLKEALAKAEEPLGWYLAGLFSRGGERFDFMKKSAEGGCSWGQFEYGMYFGFGKFVEEDGKAFEEWLEKAEKQNNPRALQFLGEVIENGGKDMKKALSYYLVSAQTGWKSSMDSLGNMFKNGYGCAKDLRQAVIWSVKGHIELFLETLEGAMQAVEEGTAAGLDCDFDQLCYTLGWGLYWYVFDSENWDRCSDEQKVFGDNCLNFYCSCVELQQKSIFQFLHFWNRTTGVKGPGQIIGKLVREVGKDNLLKSLGESEGRWSIFKRQKVWFFSFLFVAQIDYM
jgi:hypothetical protein